MRFIYIMDVCLSYFVSSGFEVNMGCLLIFNFVDACNPLVCSRHDFRKNHLFLQSFGNVEI